MDLERLSLDEVRQMSKLIETLGTPAAPDELESKINICDGASTLYRKKLDEARAYNRQHGE